MIAVLRQEWEHFKHDPPGRRFTCHRVRVRERSSRLVRVGRVVVGVVLVTIGATLLFVPGPGLLVIFFGIALFAGESAWLARLLDRAEPWARQLVSRTARWWHGTSTLTKATVITAAATLAGIAVLVGYLVWDRFVR
jgi:uncharacterized protein (TIGR02611 family)